MFCFDFKLESDAGAGDWLAFLVHDGDDTQLPLKLVEPPAVGKRRRISRLIVFDGVGVGIGSLLLRIGGNCCRFSSARVSRRRGQ